MSLPRNQFLTGDALTMLTTLPSSSIDMAVFSPPYFNLRNYDSGSDELGREANVDQWADNLVAVMRELRRVLVPTGSIWLNVGDSFAIHPGQGAPRKSLLLGPERLALRLIADGWLLRSSMVWQKRNPMPTSVRDRFASTWEHIYVLTASPYYYFDLDAARIPATSRALKRERATSAVRGRVDWRGTNAAGTAGLAALKAAGIVSHPLGKNPGDVLSLASSNYRGSHRATFPQSLAEYAIKVGCPQWRCAQCHRPWQRTVIRAPDGSARRTSPSPTCSCEAPRERGIVIDPFMGVGTTALAARALQRDWLGIELNAAFVAEAERRITEHAGRLAA